MKRNTWWYRFYRVVRLLAVAYGAVMLFACTMADRAIFLPPSASYSLTEEGVVRFGPENEFSGFYFPASDAGEPTLLWGHGNAEDAGHVRQVLAPLLDEGLGVMIYDFPGYGFSEGKPSEKGSYASAEMAFSFLLEEKKLKASQIVLLGQSVGGGPTTYLAAQGSGAGLILISPFKSAFRVITKVKILPWDRFDNLKRMSAVEMPLLLIHGEADDVIPFDHGKALFEKHRGPKEFLKLSGVGHNDLWPLANDEVLAAIIDFSRRSIAPAAE